MAYLLAHPVKTFYRATQPSAVLLVVIILLVCPSGCLSVTRMLCDKIKQCTADILIPHERAITLVFWHLHWLVGDAPSVWNLRLKWAIPFEKRQLWQISAYNVSTVRDSEKRSIVTNIGNRPRRTAIRTSCGYIFLFICSNMIEHKTILLKQLH